MTQTFILVSHLCDREVTAQMPSRWCFLIWDAKQFPGTQLASQTPTSVRAMKGQTSPSWCCDSQARLVWYLQRKTEAGRTELPSEPSRTSGSGRCLQMPSVMSLLAGSIIVTHTYSGSLQGLTHWRVYHVILTTTSDSRNQLARVGLHTVYGSYTSLQELFREQACFEI